MSTINFQKQMRKTTVFTTETIIGGLISLFLSFAEDCKTILCFRMSVTQDNKIILSNIKVYCTIPKDQGIIMDEGSALKLPTVVFYSQVIPYEVHRITQIIRNCRSKLAVSAISYRSISTDLTDFLCQK
jgi:hypothetical protein